MFERFTDRARKVMALANQEAQIFNHEYIGTEHILLGIVKEGAGVAARILKEIGISLPKVREETEKLIRRGPDMVTMGKLPYTPSAKKMSVYAAEEAQSLGHNYVGTEHLLLGLLRQSDGVASQILMNLGARHDDVRERVLNLLGAGVATEKPAASGLAAQAPDQVHARLCLWLLKSSPLLRRALLNRGVDPADIDKEVRRLMGEADLPAPKPPEGGTPNAPGGETPPNVA